MKSNFEFLKKYWPALAQIGETAENYLYSDPNACIYKIGLFTERLVQEILVFEGIVEPEKDNTHANRIRLLKRAGLLPREIYNTLYFLRKTRNSAVHTGADSVDEAKVLISMTFNLATWFMKTYGDWAYEPCDFVMPQKTSYPDFEVLITEQEKRIKELTKQLKAAVTTVSGTTQKERAKQSERVSAMMNWTEAQTRCLIDEQLQKAGWEADTKNLSYSNGVSKEFIRIFEHNQPVINNNGYYITKVIVPTEDTVGLGIDGLLQSEYYGLPSVLDSETRLKMERKYDLLVKKKEGTITEAESVLLIELTDCLENMMFARNIPVDSYYDEYVAAMHKIYSERPIVKLSAEDIAERNAKAEEILKGLLKQ